ncbi:MAG: hypothetical protein ACO1O1_14745 [Adhaeribacter sp.]
MQAERHISGQNEDQVWAQLESDLSRDPDLLQYRAHIEQQNKTILLDIDIDLGGGFEGGFATTILSARFANPSAFRFALHEEGFFDDLGKFFGMQDVEIGYPEFDERILVKTNDQARIRTLLTGQEVRQVLVSLQDFSFEIVLPEEGPEQEESTLELIIEEGITDPQRLRQIYRMFFSVLALVEAPAL